jgi:hypothetical protein
MENLHGIDAKLTATQDALKKIVDPALHSDLEKTTKKAIAALDDYTLWINEKLPAMLNDFSCGRDAYMYFLKYIALIPYTPEELLAQGWQEWNRSVAFETYEVLRNRETLQPEIFGSAAEQIAQERKDEEAVRRFLEENDIMTVPDWLQHYI